MELLLVLLLVGLCTSEKLNRAYLPPPGAKLAGGNPEDLQIPLEYPKEALSFISENNGYSTFEETSKDPEFKHGISRSGDSDSDSETTYNGSLTNAPKSYNGYMHTTANPINNFNTFSEMGYKTPGSQNYLPGFRYPNNRPEAKQDGTTDYLGSDGYHFGKPGNIPIIAVPESMLQNYNSNAFGMYGGNPMIVKSYPQSPPVEPDVFEDENNLNHSSSVLYTSDKNFNNDFQIPDFTETFSTTDLSTEPEIYQPTMVNLIKTVTFSNLNRRNQTRKTYEKRPERPQAISDRNAVILNFENVITPYKYSNSFDTSNGIHKDESAITVNGVKASGSYSYTGDDGKVYNVVYLADENGFQPKGDHLPTPPPIPDAIQRVIEQAKKDKKAGIFHDGSYDEEKYGHMKYQGPVSRYLQKIQNQEFKIRNRGFSPRKMFVRPAFIKNAQTNKYQAPEKSGQQAENVFKPIVDVNGQFGLKGTTVERIRLHPMENENTHNIENYHQTVEMSNQQANYKQKFTKPGDTKLGLQRKSFIINKEMRKNSYNRKKVADKFDSTNNSHGHQYQNDVTDKNIFKTTSSDTGYYYAPPRKIFIEGRFQDNPRALNEIPNKVSTTVKDIEIKSVPVSRLYYVDQQNSKNKYLDKSSPKVTSYFTSTVEPDLNKPNYESNLYESSTQNYFYKPVYDLGTVFITPSDDITANITPPKPYENSIKDQEETVLDDEDRQDITNLSTTPMPSEKYTLDYTFNPTEFDNTLPNTKIYSDDNSDGYLRVRPELPATFEDFPSSTRTPVTVTDNEFQTETISINVKVDGFGRPIQDSQLFNTNTPNYGYFTTKPVVNDATISNNFGEPLVKTAAEQIVTGVSDTFGLEQENARFDVEKKDRNRIIGEDFSGPKQPQRYDPGTGYFY